MNRKLYMQAIRALPEEWVDDETRIAIWKENLAVATNPKFAAMKFMDGKWEEIKLDAPFEPEGKTII